jgi:hypothetical protein
VQEFEKSKRHSQETERRIFLHQETITMSIVETSGRSDRRTLAPAMKIIARFLAFSGVNSTATSDKKTEGTSVSAGKMGSAPA